MFNFKRKDDLRKKIEECSSKIFNKDIIGETIVIVNGLSKNKDDLVITMSREAYNKLNEEIINEVIKDYEK